MLAQPPNSLNSLYKLNALLRITFQVLTLLLRYPITDRPNFWSELSCRFDNHPTNIVSDTSRSSDLEMSLTDLLPTFDLKYYFYDFWEIEGDPRIANHPFFRGGPWTTWSLIAFYVYFVKSLGPKLMKNVEPFALRRIMLIYNFTMILVNAFFFYQIIYVFNFGRDLNLFNFERVDKHDTSPKTMRIIRLAYLFFISKLVDLIETVFFVLRKKHNQISNLHVYHHSVVPLMSHLAIKVSPIGGPGTMFPLLNTLVHIGQFSC